MVTEAQEAIEKEAEDLDRAAGGKLTKAGTTGKLSAANAGYINMMVLLLASPGLVRPKHGRDTAGNMPKNQGIGDPYGTK